jgi:single-strand DNA-binding protein
MYDRKTDPRTAKERSAMQNVNRVIITANLTRDPEVRAVGSGMQVCNMRVACNGRVKDRDTGQWGDKPNYFDVVVFGNQAEVCGRYLAKGRGIAVDGRLDWREWATDSGDKRQAVQIIAETIQFLGDGGAHEGGAQERNDAPPPVSGYSGSPADDDIPF